MLPTESDMFAKHLQLSGTGKTFRLPTYQESLKKPWKTSLISNTWRRKLKRECKGADLKLDRRWHLRYPQIGRPLFIYMKHRSEPVLPQETTIAEASCDTDVRVEA